jgi:hypothetical protein
MVSCSGPAFFKQENGSKDLENIIEDIGAGAIRSKIYATGNQSQTVTMDNASALQGASIMIAPGTLSINTAITMEEANDLLSGSFLTDLGLDDAGSIDESSSALLIEPEEAVNPIGSLVISLPLASTSLALTTHSYIVVYEVFDYKNDRYLKGVIPPSQILVENGVASFESDFFGAFQVVRTQMPITVKKQIESDTKPQSKRFVAKLETLTLNRPAVNFNELNRKVRISITSSNNSKIKKCMIFIDNDKKLPFRAQKLWDTSSSDVILNTFSDKAHNLYARVECKDINERILKSEWSDRKVISAKPLLVVEPLVDITTANQGSYKISGECSFIGENVVVSGAFQADLPCINSRFEEDINLSNEGLNNGLINLTFNHQKGSLKAPEVQIAITNYTQLIYDVASTNTLIVPGDTLSCDAANTAIAAAFGPPSNYKWFHSNNPIPGNTTASITLKETYRGEPISCEASYGEVTIRSTNSTDMKVATFNEQCDIANVGVNKGNGTADAPNVICNHADLVAIDTANSNAKHYILGEDIEPPPSNVIYHIPVGSSVNGSGQVVFDAAFKGTFNGNDKTIKGFLIIGEDAGLFAKIDGATVKDLTLEGFLIASGGDTVELKKGALTGSALGSTISNIKVKNLVLGDFVNRYYNQTIGGIVGHMTDSTIENSHVSDDTYIVGEDYVGGLVGLMDGNSSINKSSVIAVVEGANKVGGLVGKMMDKSFIDSSYSAGEIKLDLESAGGIVGYSYQSSASNPIISNSYSTMVMDDVLGNYVGGLIGSLDTGSSAIKISNVYYAGTISVNSQSAIAGKIIAKLTNDNGINIDFEGVYSIDGDITTSASQAISASNEGLFNAISEPQFGNIDEFQSFDKALWKIKGGLQCQDQFSVTANIITRPTLKDNPEKASCVAPSDRSQPAG